MGSTAANGKSNVKYEVHQISSVKLKERYLPIGILGSLLVCVILYIGVCLVLTGMVPYTLLGEDAPLAEAFIAKGMKYVSILISVGAVAGLTTTLLVGLYVQSRLYLGLGRDGLLPSVFAKVHYTRHTPIHSQIWVGLVAGVMAGLLNVHVLSHILSVGSLTGYSVVSACIVTLRWKDKAASQVSSRWISTWREVVICLVGIACCGFGAGLCYRFNASFIFSLVALLIAVLATAALHYRQLHEEAWMRFVALSVISIGVYAFYGQYHADPENQHQTIIYHRTPTEEIQ